MSDDHAQIRIEGQRGSVIQYCPDCQRVSLRYGHLLLPLSVERYREFVQFFSEACERHFRHKPQQELKLRYSDVYLCFEQAEAEALGKLLQDAETEICRYKLEQSFALKTLSKN